uniref:Putative structural protein n=1 Tax=viral metagenome TaxID=1070528 RepID=A0A6M3JCT9_9ZZZZ
MAKSKKNHAHCSDNVFRPQHYTQYLQEPFTFFFLNNLPFAEASVCKYVLRWRQKNGIEDLQKAKRLIDMMIEMETNKKDYIAKKTCL